MNNINKNSIFESNISSKNTKNKENLKIIPVNNVINNSNNSKNSGKSYKIKNYIISKFNNSVENSIPSNEIILNSKLNENENEKEGQKIVNEITKTNNEEINFKKKTPIFNNGNISINNVKNLNNVNNYFNFHDDTFKTRQELIDSIKKSLLDDWKNKLTVNNSENFSLLTGIKKELNINNAKNIRNPLPNIFDSGTNLLKSNKSNNENLPKNKLNLNIHKCKDEINQIKDILEKGENQNNLNYEIRSNFLVNEQNELYIKKKISNMNMTFSPALKNNKKELLILPEANYKRNNYNSNSLSNLNQQYKNLDKDLDKNLDKNLNKNSDALVFLVIEDNLMIRDSIKHLLQMILKNLKKKALIKKDFQIFEGADGIDALKFLIDPNIGSRVKGIFIDENMEYLNGSETIRIIRNLQNLNKIQKFNIATITAFEDAVTRKTILNSGVDEIYNKPLHKNDLEEFFKKYPIRE